MRRYSVNRSHAPDEEESVFVTMTDLTISFLLVIMILLAFFAAQLSTNDSVSRVEYERLLAELQRLKESNPLEKYLSEAIEQRFEILIAIRDRLLIEFPDLEVVISPEQDALRFQGEGLFESGSSQLEPGPRRIVETMGQLLDDILVCFTLGVRALRGNDCTDTSALIEAVQIEGHTDSDGSDLWNLTLSTARANATLGVMFDDERSILQHLNLRGQPVMSVAGYGEMRPIASNDTVEGKASNRRIDLRIIMYAPSSIEEVDEVSRRLDELRNRSAVP